MKQPALRIKRCPPFCDLVSATLTLDRSLATVAEYPLMDDRSDIESPLRCRSSRMTASGSDQRASRL